MILVDPNFEWHENFMVFREFIFVLFFVCLKPTVRKDTWMRTTFVTVMVMFLKGTFWK